MDDASHEGSIEGHDGPSEKRANKKRKVLSCYACRSRKMKCDRVYPVCGRCEKTGRSDQCAYDPRLLEESMNGHTEGDNGPIVLSDNSENSAKNPTHGDAAAMSLEWKMRSQERRIESLEHKLAAQDPNNEHLRQEHFSSEVPSIPEEMVFRGKGFKTSFHGATSIMSSITRYRQLQSFTREALTVDHPIKHIKTDFKTFRDRKKSFAHGQRGKLHGTDEEVLAALPQRSVIETQAVIYFQTWETSYKILHQPSFWDEYGQFWEHSHTSENSTSFAVILLLIVASTKCVNHRTDVFIADTTVDRQAAAELIDICDAWIAQQPRKRPTLTFFQVHCLSLLAKRANCVRVKQDWVNSGDLVRLAIASGMHRDPTLLATGKISDLNKEMKKRLWATIAELELQSSLEAGLQSSLTSLYIDTPAPMNVDDESLSREPPQMQLEQFTSVSYLVASYKSLPLRIQLAQLLNTPTSNLQYSDVLHYDACIHKAIASLPNWEERLAQFASALLRLQLWQYLIMLHKPYAKLAPKDPRYVYSFTTIIDTASSIIGIYQDMDPSRVLALNHFRNDVLRVGITISQVIYANCNPIEVKSAMSLSRDIHPKFAHSESHFADIPIHERNGQLSVPLTLAVLPTKPSLSRTLCLTALELLESTREIFEHKVMRLGTGYMEFWLLSAAIGMLPAPPSPSTSIAYVTHAKDDIPARCKRTLDTFTALAFRVLALQKDGQTNFSSTSMPSISPSEARTPNAAAGNVADSNGTTQPTDPSIYNGVPDLGLGVVSGDASKDLGGPFDVLQDMQVDMSGWPFPDFWEYDLGGDY